MLSRDLRRRGVVAASAASAAVVDGIDEAGNVTGYEKRRICTREPHARLLYSAPRLW